MNHAVAKHFRCDRDQAAGTYKPASSVNFEQNIGLEAHIGRAMPLFLTLRDAEGAALVTSMLAPGGRDDSDFRIIIVAKENSDPYPAHLTAIDALGVHFGLSLDRERCFPYLRSETETDWDRGAVPCLLGDGMVPPVRIELTTPPLPRVCSTPELRRQARGHCHSARARATGSHSP